MSVHFVSTELLSFVLETRAFPERHTGVAISEKLTSIASNYAIADKVLAVVHDQAANMELSLNLLNNDLGWESIHCSAHCLQLCIKDGLSTNSIERMITAARNLLVISTTVCSIRRT